MHRGTQYLRFGIIAFIGALGMILLKDYLFNLATLLFVVAIFIFLVLVMVPEKEYSGRLDRG